MSSDTKPAKSDDRLTFAWVIIAFAILPVVTAADYLTGFEFQFSIFYLVSIYLATWRGGGAGRL